MLSKKIVNLAKELEKLEIWEKLYDTQIFALQLSDGQKVYISMMGKEGSCRATGIYPGDEGWNSLLKIQQGNLEEMEVSDREEQLLCQDSLSIYFDGSEPDFCKNKPACIPVRNFTAADKKIFEEVLTDIIEIEKKYDFSKLNIHDFFEDFKMILLTKKDEDFELSEIKMTDRFHSFMPKFEFSDNEVFSKIKAHKKSGFLNCKLVLIPFPIDENDKNGTCPYTLLTISNKGFAMPGEFVMDLKNHGVDLLQSLTDLFLEKDLYFSKIYVPDDRTFVLLENFCEKCGIKLEKKDSIPELENLYEGILKQFQNQYLEKPSEETVSDMKEVFETLSKMSMEELRTLPADVKSALMELLETGSLPVELQFKLRNL